MKSRQDEGQPSLFDDGPTHRTDCKECNHALKKFHEPEGRCSYPGCLCGATEPTFPVPQVMGGQPDYPLQDTSREAFIASKERKGKTQERIYKLIMNARHGKTDDELEVLTGILHQTLGPARGQLAKNGWIKDSGEKRTTRNGRKAIVWVVDNDR